MIANELRACLDSVACQLAIRNGKDPKNVYFPISKSKEIFEDDGMKKIRKLSASDQAAIVDLAPYKEANPTLFGLHEADRTRKHQRLGAAASRNTQSNIGNVFRGGSDTRNSRISNLNLNGVFVRDLYFFGIDPGKIVLGKEFIFASGVPVNLPFSIDFDVAYEEPPELDGQSVGQALTGFADAVADIVSKFD
jgi:hypothetical protein